MTATLSLREARRLALARAGLLPKHLSGLPERAAGRGKRARERAHRVIERFGYLQLDTVSVAGARSHAIQLMSRLEGIDPELPESLLEPGAPLFEYWGHEACWMPLELYPYFAFRRREYRRHPWWGNVLERHPDVAESVLRRIRDEGPLRSADLEGESGSGWWNFKLTKKVATALWSGGELAIRERRAFQRTFDLPERVIPRAVLEREVSYGESLRVLLERALSGHGWASTGTLAATWRLRNCREALDRALAELEEGGRIVPCGLVCDERGHRDHGRRIQGWIRPRDLELAARLRTCRPHRGRGVLLTPFDPLLWDRGRTRLLFGFDYAIEIFKPAEQRQYGYFCMPVLQGERLVARLDLKADRRSSRLDVLSLHWESEPDAAMREAAGGALERYASGLRLAVAGAGGIAAS